MKDSIESEQLIIGSRIRDARVAKGMSQTDLAEKANLSLPLISNVELGKTRMQLPTFVQIVEALQVSADSILRPDVPAVYEIYSKEMSELLADCTVSEKEAILKIVRELKNTMHSQKKDD